MCRCVYTSARTLLWLVEGRSIPRARFSERSPPIGRAGGRDVEHFIILSAHSSPRREAPLQDTREADRDSREWPRFFFFIHLLALRFHRNPWQVHVWVGREREQSWLWLGNHVLLLRLKLRGFLTVHEEKHSKNFFFADLSVMTDKKRSAFYF